MNTTEDIMEHDEATPELVDRKRKWEEKAELVNIKRRKLKDNYERIMKQIDEWEDNSETEDEYEDDSNITEGYTKRELAPQEILLLRKDPFNTNCLATTWTNENTSLRQDSPFLKWLKPNIPFYSDIFPKDIFAEIVARSRDPNTLFQLRVVCKATNVIVIESHDIWKELFYQKRWRLKHDILNNFVPAEGVDPDWPRSEWYFLVPDDQIDWFAEYRRNIINKNLIRQAIQSIHDKIHRIDGEQIPGDNHHLYFVPPESAELIDYYSAIKPITNDIRELLNCCNGVRFCFSIVHNALMDDCFEICFPMLTNMSSNSRLDPPQFFFDKEEKDCYKDCDIYSNIGSDNITGPHIGPEFNSDDLESDSEDYLCSDQETSIEDSDEEMALRTGSKFPRRNSFLPNDKSIRVWCAEENLRAMIFNTIDGSVTHVTKSRHELALHDSIVSYLQKISDYLEFEHSRQWVKFGTPADWMSGDYDKSVNWTEIWDLGHLNTAPDVMLSKMFKSMTGDDRYFVPRAEKILIAAAKDFAIKIFAKAQELELTDTLQPDTLIEAVRQVSPEFKNYERITRNTIRGNRGITIRDNE